MEDLIQLITSNEEWLMYRILQYAKAREYTKYTSTLVEAWRLSISGLSESFIIGLKKYKGIPELTPDEDYSKDPVAAFGILEAQRHRSRGITLSMFLGLMKYYRQSYIDLVSSSKFDEGKKDLYIKYLNLFFDRLEIGFSSEWCNISENKIIEDLQSMNRTMTNEKNKYLTIFDSMNTPIFFLNLHNKIENLNHATSEYFDFCKTSGEKYYETVKKDTELYFLKDEVKEFIESNKEKIEFEKYILTKKGNVYFQVKMKRMLDVSGKFFGTVVILNDLTELRNTSESLKQSEQRYKNIVKDQTEFITRFTSDGTHTFVNDAYCNYMGMKREELIGKSFFSFLPKEDRKKLKSILDSLTITNPIKEIEHRYILDGKIRWLHWINRAIFDDDGNLFEYQAVGRDITDKKRIEEELKESEEKYRELVENANSIILKFDNEGRILSMNEFGLKYFGYSEKELIGKNGIGTIIPKIYSSGKDLKKLINNMINFESEYQSNINENIKKNGQRVWVHWTNKPLKDDQGNIHGILCVGTDITERKKAEDKIKELNETLRILNKILRHDILNDLTIVLTVCDLMGDVNPKLKEKASRALEKSINLIERIRELEQAIISGENVQKVEINKVILEVIKNYPEIDFKVTGQCEICTDEAIFSVLDNIIRNAIIHGKTKKIDIDIIRTEKMCKVRIADYGIGIPDNIKHRIFEEGFSYGNHKSTGLGLYIVKKIVERYGGAIKVEDNTPKGAIFTIIYPTLESKNIVC
ncbi:MAG: PAS domain-containing sensor histidine kinase [Candidatus Methanofastidiosa archaeon]|nr:PAS domain-containing sensor histidine kinase [Candidatus Methanofastidiosa archaeon]